MAELELYGFSRRRMCIVQDGKVVSAQKHLNTQTDLTAPTRITLNDV